jgi:choline kinase
MGGKGPKTLIPIGGGEPMLHYILEGLKIAGIDDLLVVTGFGSTEIQNYVGDQWAGEATYVFNARWASWGNFHSVRVALDQSPGLDLLVVNSDVVVPPDVYSRVTGIAADLVLAVQRRRDLDEEDMRVEVHGDEVRQIGKGISMARSHGEFAGISLVRPGAARAYLDAATDIEWHGDTHIYYEDVYARMIGTIETRAAFLRGDEYAEVDSPEDVEAARDVVTRHQESWGHASPQGQPA